METGSDLPDATVARIRDSFARQGLMRLLGAELAGVKAGLVTIRLPFKPDLTQQHGYFHAGGTASCLMTSLGFLAIREPLPGTPNMPGSGGGRIENGSAVAGRAVV